MEHKIFITGDIHGQIDIAKINKKNWPDQFNLTRQDYLLQLGDLGLLWKKDKTFNYLLDFYTSRKYTLLWIDGNHCFSKDTELLTTQGWRNIVECYNDSDVILANFDINTREIFFNKPNSRCIEYQNSLIEISGSRTKQIVSLEHDVIINTTKCKAIDLLGKKAEQNLIPMTGFLNSQGINISDDMIRLIVWIVCDGTIVDFSKRKSNSKKCTIQFKLSKERKIQKLSELLNRLHINFSLLPATKCRTNVLQPFYIRFHGDKARLCWNILGKKKQFPDWFRQLSKKQFLIFLEELSITDGHRVNKNYIKWQTIDKHNIDLVQEICLYHNIVSYYNSFHSGGFSNKLQYDMTIFNNIVSNKHKLLIRQIQYNNYVYCFSMPHGTLITRIGGKVAFSGNCNFNILNSFPIETWNGGKVHKIADNIFHLMRGEIYNIYNKTFFTFGGGLSIDKNKRIIYIDWWPEEEANYQEQINAINNLEKYNYKIDYVLTHSAPELIKNQVGFKNYTSNTEQFLQYINNKLTFNKWFIGHYHIDQIYQNYYFIYNKILSL